MRSWGFGGGSKKSRLESAVAAGLIATATDTGRGCIEQKRGFASKGFWWGVPGC